MNNWGNDIEIKHINQVATDVAKMDFLVFFYTINTARKYALL